MFLLGSNRNNIYKNRITRYIMNNINWPKQQHTVDLNRSWWSDCTRWTKQDVQYQHECQQNITKENVLIYSNLIPEHKMQNKQLWPFTRAAQNASKPRKRALNVTNVTSAGKMIQLTHVSSAMTSHPPFTENNKRLLLATTPLVKCFYNAESWQQHRNNVQNRSWMNHWPFKYFKDAH